ncbi:Methyltransferase domain-containing protein [Geopseudomonas sagittaria]|uniref:Methyltransferase domain-containing protein n=1 Tax=Geopseudomonas sagittaria TaxID=1135990 RepID=A0A1I5XXV0_9GAMM|nr:methyltransferase domain-containing protein [Pseudomonas sagittaria]SFQ36821.1 Methyltransferase domain-containing protein [Pseudomonas sagittaria]
MNEPPCATVASDWLTLQREAEAWFAGPLGRLLLDSQQSLLEQQLGSHFGSFLLHYGFSAGELPPQRQITHYIRLGPPLPGVEIVCEEGAWPVLEHAADVVVLQHALDFAVSPHQLLREAARCVRPGGHLLVVGIHPWSLWGLRQLLPGDALAGARCIAPNRLADWLHLLGFALEKRRFGCYCPPLSSARWQARLRGVESWAESLQLPGGGVYLLAARKLMAGLRPLPQSRRATVAPLRPVSVAKVGRHPGKKES